MAEVTLRYDDGTIRIEGAVPDLPFVQVDERSDTARAPAYRYAALRQILDTTGLVVDDRVLDPPELALSTTYELREYQREALDAWHSAGDRGVIELPTGSGKTVIGIAAAVACATPTLIVAPTIDLVEQWREEVTAEFDLPIGQLGGDHQQLEAVTVATYDSAYLRAEELGDRFGLVVFDEVHHLGGEGYRDIARLLAAPARLGLTATFERPDGAHEIVEELIGSKVFDLDAEALAGEHLAAYDIRRIEVELTPDEREAYEQAQGRFVEYLRSSDISFSSGSDYQKLVMRSGTDPQAREALLAKQRARELMMNSEAKVQELADILDRHRDDRVIVFTAHTELVYRLSERFLLPAITAETENTQANPERRRILEKFREGEYSKIVAANVLDEGVDVPDATVGVILSGSGSEREFTQRLGRILRPLEDGSRAILYEVVSVETAEERVADRRR
jgi:superfamily II DNA or RNA helicase